MPTNEEYVIKVRTFDKTNLKNLWDDILAEKKPADWFWKDGKAFEYLILRAFELEGAIIRWPYRVSLFEEIVEEVDGAIHLQNGLSLSVIIECKNQAKDIKIEPIAKLRNKLYRRPANSIGAFFTTSNFTPPALVLSQFVFPQTIILWEKGHIDFCIKNSNFTEGMIRKYRRAIEEGDTNFDITI